MKSGLVRQGRSGWRRSFYDLFHHDRKDREVSVIVAAVKASQPVGHRSAKRAGAWPEDFGVVRLESSALILGEEPML